MGKRLRIELDSNDLGQAVDGLEARAQAWENTARYLRTGESPDEFFMPEECRDSEEAESIASHYRSIIAKIRKQQEEQT